MSPMKPVEGTTNLGKMLRTYRAIQGWDLRTFAKFLDISAPTLMRIEKGRGMDAATWHKIQSFLMREAS
jgi:transcriptional regulator with XRE-family HTH domain